MQIYFPIEINKGLLEVVFAAVKSATLVVVKVKSAVCTLELPAGARRPTSYIVAVIKHI